MQLGTLATLFGIFIDIFGFFMGFSEYCCSIGVNLLRDDITFIRQCLQQISYNQRKQVLDEYANIWTNSMNQCQNDVAAENVGRRAANLYLLNKVSE